MMIVKRWFLRVVIDASAMLALTGALITVYWVDRSATQNPQLESRGLLDLMSNDDRLDARNGGDSGGSSDRKQDEVESASTAWTDPAQLDAFQSDHVAGLRTETNSGPKTFPSRMVPISTIPADLPTFPVQLERPRLTEQVSFFKLEAKATTVVFLVDASGSMAGHRFERAQSELGRAIGELNPYQSFAIAFFNEQFIFMPITGNKRPVLSKAKSEAKSKAIGLMQAVRAFAGTNPEPAIIAAAELKPQVIFLLTDGEFQPLSTQTFRLLSENQIQVFTIGFDSAQTSGTLENISAQTGGKFRAAAASEAPHAMFLAKSSTVFESLAASDPEDRLAATIVAFCREMTHVRRSKPNQETSYPSSRELSFAHKIPQMLNDSNDRVRREIHHRLVIKALGSDFGPADFNDPAQIGVAVDHWSKWCTCFFEKNHDEVVEGLSSIDPVEQWVAASVIRIAGWEISDVLIEKLSHVSVEARKELRAALTIIADGSDFGPEPEANDEQVALSVTNWCKWRETQKRRLDEETTKREEEKRLTSLKKKHDEAASRLCVADMTWKSGRKERAQTLFEKIVKEYPDTPAAAEAKERLR